MKDCLNILMVCLSFCKMTGYGATLTLLIYILKIEPFMLHALPPVPTARRIRELQYSLGHHHILKDVEFLQC